MLSKPIKTDPELLTLLQKYKDYEMSPEEIRAQRRSWVIGNMMLDHPEMTREYVESIYNNVEKNMGY